MRSSLWASPVLVPMFALGLACSSTPTSFFDDGGTDPNNPFGGDSGNPMLPPGMGGDSGTMGGGCNPDPGNYDFPMNNCDDDGDGTVDNPNNLCDMGLPSSGDANQFAKAIGLCQQATGAKWGVVSAAYTQGYMNNTPPAAVQHGILPKYGSVLKARQGSSLGVLSSGEAGEYDTCNMLDGKSFKFGCPETGPGSAPPGYPKPATGCPGNNAVNDVSVVKLQVKVPNNAKGFSFDFNFFSGEWPEWVCTDFNDAFVAFLQSAAFNGGKPDNISFDAKNNPVSVNNGFFDRCSPMNASVGCSGGSNGTSACAGGSGELSGTGFLDPGMNCGQNDSGGGATGWLTTTTAVQPGETITIQFMVWDTGDQAYDSSILLDNWTWQEGAVSGPPQTGRPPN